MSGRWPGNVLLDPEAAALLDAMSGERPSGAWNGKRNTPKTRGIYGDFESRPETGKAADTGGASRFFFTASHDDPEDLTDVAPMEETEGMTILHGDCRAVMATMEPNSVDAIVTDPPYGLSKEPDIAEVLTHWLNGDDYRHGSIRKGKQHCAGHIFRNAIVADTGRADAHIGKQSIPFRITVSPVLVGAPSVKLDNEQTFGKEEVHHERAVIGIEDMLVNEGDAEGGHTSGGSQFRLWMGEAFAACVGECRCFAHSSDAVVRVPVWLRDDAVSESEAPTGVVALRGTEVRAVLALDVRGRTGELIAAESTDKINPAFLLAPAQTVGAGTRTGGLPSEFESRGIGEIGGSADRTDALNVVIHRVLLERFTSPIIHQGGFMGKTWDSFVPGPAYWREAYRVLKPGGHIAAFGGTRTVDLLTIALRMAGFEIRDTAIFLHGQGFPKGQDFAADREATRREGRRIPKPEFVGTPFEQGWNCAMKPAHEPIVLARKPLGGSTIAGNVLAWGTGALNIDATRIGTDDTRGKASPTELGVMNDDGWQPKPVIAGSSCGRWPPNVLMDETAAACLDAMSGERGKSQPRRALPQDDMRATDGIMAGYHSHNRYATGDHPGYGDTGGASRFMAVMPAAPIDDPDAEHTRMLYTPKASRAERSAGLDKPSHHPTVKPIALMRWLCRLITPPRVLVCEQCYNYRHEHSTTPLHRTSTVRDMRQDIQATEQLEAGQVLLEGLPVRGAEENHAEDVRVVRGGLPTGSPITTGTVLQQEVFNAVNGGEAGQGLCDRSEGVSTSLFARESDGEQGRLCDGASSRDVSAFGENTSAERGCSPQERHQGRQPNREPGTDGEASTRPDSEAGTEADNLPALRGQDQGFGTCPTCNGPLTQRPGTILDPFAGSGTTGCAASLEGFQSILIEQEAEYIPIIERRVAYWRGKGVDGVTPAPIPQNAPPDDADDEGPSGYTCDRCGWVPFPEGSLDENGYTGRGCPSCGSSWTVGHLVQLEIPA